MLRFYYLTRQNYPLFSVDEKRYVYDVVFLGHYEDDDRLLYIQKLTEAGITVGVPKSSWSEKINNKCLLQLENTGTAYNQILNESKIALVFLSTLNKDTYTRRCFEIPAARTFMLS